MALEETDVDPSALDVAALLRAPLDPRLADANRLRIMAALVGLPLEGSMRFTELARTLGLSDGNLGTHLVVLEDAGLVECAETWRGKRRTRWYSASGSGRDAFTAHVQSLRSLIAAAEGPGGVSPAPHTSPR